MIPWTSIDIRFLVVIVTTGHLGLFWLLHGKNIYRDCRGPDKIWQMVEVFAIHVIVVWTGMIVGATYFDFKPPAEAWQSINFGLGVSVLGVVGKKVNDKWVGYLAGKSENETDADQKKKDPKADTGPTDLVL